MPAGSTLADDIIFTFVGRKFLPGKQFTTGDSTTGDHQRLPLQGFEGVAADEHVDTIILGIKGETVLLLQVSGPNLMQGENCELFHSLISSSDWG